MRKILLILISIQSLSVVLFAQQNNKDLFVQFSTYQALSAGLYQGFVELGEVRKYGDTGIGTYDSLDGEMILIDGTFLQVKDNGAVNSIDDLEKTPFASVAFFEPDKEIQLKSGMSYKDVQNEILKAMPAKNMFYIIRIDGRFKSMTSRSVLVQKPPYPPLSNVLANQISKKNIVRKATLIGLYSPPFSSNTITTPEFHFHFVSGDRKLGGHVLDFVVENVTCKIDQKSKMLLILPDTDSFRNANFSVSEEKKLEPALAAPVSTPETPAAKQPASKPAPAPAAAEPLAAELPAASSGPVIAAPLDASSTKVPVVNAKPVEIAIPEPSAAGK